MQGRNDADRKGGWKRSEKGVVVSEDPEKWEGRAAGPRKSIMGRRKKRREDENTPDHSFKFDQQPQRREKID